MSGDALARLEAALADALEAVRDLRRGDVANDPPAEPRRRRTLTEDEAAERAQRALHRAGVYARRQRP